MGNELWSWAWLTWAYQIDRLRSRKDSTREADPKLLEDSSIIFGSNACECRGRDIYIVAVPTPVNLHYRPHVSPLLSAIRTVAELIDARTRPTIVFESTTWAVQMMDSDVRQRLNSWKRC
jgi:UDP-N-acetyl-D-galactosamine dehydrogenase